MQSHTLLIMTEMAATSVRMMGSLAHSMVVPRACRKADLSVVMTLAQMYWVPKWVALSAVLWADTLAPLSAGRMER